MSPHCLATTYQRAKITCFFLDLPMIHPIVFISQQPLDPQKLNYIHFATTQQQAEMTHNVNL